MSAVHVLCIIGAVYTAPNMSSKARLVFAAVACVSAIILTIIEGMKA